MWEYSLGAVYADKTWGDGKMGISSVEGFDRDAKFVCEKGMTGHVADEIGGIALRVTSQTYYSPEYTTPTQKKKCIFCSKNKY